jgi:cell division protein FtsB
MWSSALPIFCLALVVYFGYYGLYGQNGLISLVQLSRDVELKKAELSKLEVEKTQLARRVDLLGPKTLDPDLLDEQARASLGYAAPGEITVFEKDERDP